MTIMPARMHRVLADMPHLARMHHGEAWGVRGKVRPMCGCAHNDFGGSLRPFMLGQHLPPQLLMWTHVKWCKCSCVASGRCLKTGVSGCACAHVHVQVCMASRESWPYPCIHARLLCLTWRAMSHPRSQAATGTPRSHHDKVAGTHLASSEKETFLTLRGVVSHPAISTHTSHTCFLSYLSHTHIAYHTHTHHTWYTASTPFCNRMRWEAGVRRWATSRTAPTTSAALVATTRCETEGRGGYRRGGWRGRRAQGRHVRASVTQCSTWMRVGGAVAKVEEHYMRESGVASNA